MCYFDDYWTPEGRHEPNWVMLCKKHRDGKCSKRRGAIPAYESKFGIIEPLAWLHVWHSIEWPSKPTITSHAKETPANELVWAFAEAHKEELMDVCRRAGRC